MSDENQEIVPGLWNEGVDKNSYDTKEKYQDHILEQYKLYVEMADRISSRRTTANTFFLTLHSGIVAALGISYEQGFILSQKWGVVFVFILIISSCYAWGMIIRSYSQLNTAKYKVIGEFERRLPASPYWSAEWKALGEGKDSRLYTPLTHIEEVVPRIFFYMYSALTIIFLLS